MSKLQLKKELAQLDREQLLQLILDLYSTRKEAKIYFDFFLNPDVENLYEKYCKAIDKEMSRGKYSRCTARISIIKGYIKEFASFDVGAETVVEIMLYALALGLQTERRRYISEPLLKGIVKLANDILVYADKEAVFDSTHRKLSSLLDGTVGTLGFVNYIRRSLDWSLIKR